MRHICDFSTMFRKLMFFSAFYRHNKANDLSVNVVMVGFRENCFNIFSNAVLQNHGVLATFCSANVTRHCDNENF